MAGTRRKASLAAALLAGAPPFALAVQPSPKGGSARVPSLGPGVTGGHPTTIGLAGIVEPPAGRCLPRGLAVDSNGLAWTGRAGGHMARLDRSKCREPLTGPRATAGEHCDERQTPYRLPCPDVAGADRAASADRADDAWVDRFNTLGLGNDMPIASTNGCELLAVLVKQPRVAQARTRPDPLAR